MANMREIRARIKSVKSTQQITKAMKMVSAAKLRRAQSGMDGMRLFADRCRAVMARIPTAEADEPLLQPRPQVERVCYVVFVGNRGLCGNYNQALVRYAGTLVDSEEQEPFVVIVGRWGRDVMEDAGLPVRDYFTDYGDAPTMEDASQLTEYLKKLYLDGAADRIHLVYQHYRTALQQTPTSRQLLPIQPEDGAGENSADYIFEPSVGSVLRRAVELYVKSEVFSVLLEAKAGEQAARMTAMTAATDATDELIGQLSLELNRARQTAITTEIAEIVGGANALKHSGENA